MHTMYRSYIIIHILIFIYISVHIVHKWYFLPYLPRFSAGTITVNDGFSSVHIVHKTDGFWPVFLCRHTAGLLTFIFLLL